ncbi:MAG TPA: DUF6461 domain-containing protein [Candidatus Dormibacteraeota bacterium]|nr:DUF6461 domain-containing protein [Candidatus Dormibacteraeota bacterium]
MGGIAWESFAWADAFADGIDGLTIALVRPVIEDPATAFAVVGRLTPDRTLLEAVDAAFQLDDFAWGSEISLFDRLGDWTVVIQPAGWGASVPEELTRLSVGGAAASVYWNVNAVMSASFASGGELLRTFDPLLYDAAGALDEERGLPFGVAHARAAALAFLARVTGVAIERDWLLTPRRPAYRVRIPST